MPQATKGRAISALLFGGYAWRVTKDQVWQYAEDLRRFAQYLCHDIQDAEDVAQNALVKAAQSRGGAFRAEASVRTWLHTIVTNECRMLHRQHHSESLDVLLEDAPSLLLSGNAGRKETLPEDAALIAEARRTVLSALRELPHPYQQVLVLRDGCGMRTAEVSEILGLTDTATKSRLYRARKTLRTLLDGRRTTSSESEESQTE